MTLLEEGKYLDAYDALLELNGYKDSEALANSIYKELNAERLKNIEAGDYLRFGTYEQDNNTANSVETIEWLVLERDGNDLVLISKYILEATYYHGSKVNTTWAESDMRAYLNNWFYITAFDEMQRQIILKSTLTTPDSTNGVDGGPDTEDKVYLLSIEEAAQYFTSDEERMAAYTPLVIAIEPSLEWTSKTCQWGKTCGWFLRSPGYSQENRTDYASGVGSDGSMSELQTDCRDIYGVRPVIRIDLQTGMDLGLLEYVDTITSE